MPPHPIRVVTVWFRDRNEDWDCFYYVYMSDGTEYSTPAWSTKFDAPEVIKETDRK